VATDDATTIMEVLVALRGSERYKRGRESGYKWGSRYHKDTWENVYDF